MSCRDRSRTKPAVEHGPIRNRPVHGSRNNSYTFPANRCVPHIPARQRLGHPRHRRSQPAVRSAAAAISSPRPRRYADRPTSVGSSPGTRLRPSYVTRTTSSTLSPVRRSRKSIIRRPLRSPRVREPAERSLVLKDGRVPTARRGGDHALRGFPLRSGCLESTSTGKHSSTKTVSPIPPAGALHWRCDVT